MKLTYGDIKEGMAKVLSLPAADSRVMKYVNEAQERLVYKGKWQGTTVRYALSNSDGAITWPRQLETVEAVAVEDTPAIIRNEWYEFLESGPGIQDSENGDDLTLIDRGEAVCFSDIDGVNKKLKAVSTDDADEFKTMLLQGYDESGDWIRSSDVRKGTYARALTVVTITITAHGLTTGDSIVIDFTSGDATDGTYTVTVTDADTFTVTDAASGTSTGNVTYTNSNVILDGEKVTLAASSGSVTTTNIFSVLSGVIRDQTSFNVLLKEYDPSTATDRNIGEYEPTETRPTYRRSLIAGLPDISTKTVTVIGKLRFSPITKDNDWLYINFESALKLMVMALRKEETNSNDAAAYEGKAIQLLQDQLMHYMGDGSVAVPRFPNSSTFGGGGVVNLQ